MSLLRRPAGDEVAEHYGKYFDANTLRFIKRGEKYEVLCSDGLNYIVEVKEVDPDTLRVHLHFPNWKNRFDFKGCLKDIYITEEGMYSREAGITANNTYDFEGNGMGINSTKRDRLKKSMSGVKTSYAANTKYDPDFFSKPRPSWAKKRRMSESDSSQQGDDIQGLSNENMSQDDTSSDDGSTIHVKDESAMVLKRQRIEDIALFRASISPTKSENNEISVLANKVPQHALLQHFMGDGGSVGMNKTKHKLSRDIGRNETSSKASTLNNSSSKVGIVDLMRQTTTEQSSKLQSSSNIQRATNTISNQSGNTLKIPMSISPSYVGRSSEFSTKLSQEPIKLQGSLEIPDDVKMLVDALELSYTVDETQKVIDVITNKTSNINVENKSHVDLLLRLLQIRRNIDQSILSVIESNE